MADITRVLFARHLRTSPTSWGALYKNGAARKQGRGLAAWYLPLGANLVEVPLDDREVPFLFHASSVDYQDVTVQGIVTYRIAEPVRLAERVDFGLDPESGKHREQPLDKLALLLSQLAQQHAVVHIARLPLRKLLEGGLDEVRRVVEEGLTAELALAEMGLSLVSTRVASLKPTAEMEKALQMPTREAIQQAADEATFARRALAVEKERAIQENELTNKVELAKREEQLIEQRGQNARRSATERAEAQRIEVEAEAQQVALRADAEAGRIRAVQAAEVDAERERMAIYRELPAETLLGLAARQLAGSLHSIEHLNISPELLGPALARLAQAGTAALEGAEPRRSS
jgi:regulator of protease activity HflC (stomatin/prohibitin superfamily)